MSSFVDAIKRKAGKILSMLPPRVAHSLIYFRNHGRRLNWVMPSTYDEKIHWCLARKYVEGYSRYADKFRVRDYVAQNGLGSLLIPLYGVYTDAKMIDFESLPDSFILKTTHGSGLDFYEICRNKSDLDVDRVRDKMNRALQVDYSTYQCEYQYAGISPRIVCEKLLCEGNGARVDDYKVICTNGKPEAILLCTERSAGLDYYSLDWTPLEYTKPSYQSGQVRQKPAVLEEMLAAAETLSRPFPLSRIDFYVANSRLWFGEITLSPAAGNHRNLTSLGQHQLGLGMVTR
ncbi:MAG: hypothetical protein HDQ87_04965 [Clostridia bacterium]|nr:hypothetical protein [Clostridia bacterium]